MRSLFENGGRMGDLVACVYSVRYSTASEEMVVVEI